MGTTRQILEPGDAHFPTSNPPAPTLVQGTNFPVPGLAFDAATQETCFFPFAAEAYGSGNLTIRIQWYADSASSGGVAFGASLAAITPNTDTQDVETKAFATEVIGTDTHLGTTGQRDHEFSITLTQLDSLANGDDCVLRIRRAPADAGDTMTGDAIIKRIIIEYSDT
jgi:hypothetical protein